jgi:Flp pilus assembly pilin Flp
MRALSSFTGKEEGAALVEYGLLVALIAIASITAIIATGTAPLPYLQMSEVV